MCRVVRKPTFCRCENKDADQLCGNCEADQRLCFRYLDSTIPLLPKNKVSNLELSPVAVQPGLCQTWSESTVLVFPRCGSNDVETISLPLSLKVKVSLNSIGKLIQMYLKNHIYIRKSDQFSFNYPERPNQPVLLIKIVIDGLDVFIIWFTRHF